MAAALLALIAPFAEVAAGKEKASQDDIEHLCNAVTQACYAACRMRYENRIASEGKISFGNQLSLALCEDNCADADNKCAEGGGSPARIKPSKNLPNQEIRRKSP